MNDGLSGYISSMESYLQEENLCELIEDFLDADEGNLTSIPILTDAQMDAFISGEKTTLLIPKQYSSRKEKFDAFLDTIV